MSARPSRLRKADEFGILFLMLFLLVLSIIPYGSFQLLGLNGSTTPSVGLQVAPVRSAQAGGYFGASVAIGSNYTVAGASHNNGSGLYGAGEVFITNAKTGQVLYTLTSPNAQTDGRFGWDVAASGEDVVVGAFKETADNLTEAGNAYVFSGITGKLLFTLTSPDPQAYGLFGETVAVSGNYVVVSAPDETVSGQAGAGQVYVYDATTGSLLYTLASADPQHGGSFGYSLAVSGDTLVVGASYETVSGLEDAGSAYVFNISTGALLFPLTIPDPEAGGYFGEAVAASGSYIVVGAPFGEAAGFQAAGNAYIFSASTGTLLYSLASPNAQLNGYFGLSVAVSGTSVYVGAPWEKVSGMNAAGRVYIFDAATGALVSTMTSPDAQAGGVYGEVSASGGAVAVGAPGETTGQNGTAVTGAGNAYTYG